MSDYTLCAHERIIPIMALLALSCELLCAIAHHLHSESDLNAFAQTNRLLYQLTNPYLYNHNIRYSNNSALL
jgi:hypothetical protein